MMRIINDFCSTPIGVGRHADPLVIDLLMRR
jgi:hypothetical protein